MKTIETMTLQNGTNGTFCIDIGHYAKGLAITPIRVHGKLPKDPWTITHSRSGKRVVHYTFNITTAKKLMNLLLALPIDWEQGEERVYKLAKADPITARKIHHIVVYNPNTSKMEWLLEDLNACNPS